MSVGMSCSELPLVANVLTEIFQVDAPKCPTLYARRHNRGVICEENEIVVTLGRLTAKRKIVIVLYLKIRAPPCFSLSILVGGVSPGNRDERAAATLRHLGHGLWNI